MNKKIAILGAPRSGTSLLSGLLKSSGFLASPDISAKFFQPSEMNVDGYYEDVKFTLLNDQLIKYAYGDKYSFLYPPRHIKALNTEMTSSFSYDISKETLDIPRDYKDNIAKYTGSEKDWWGISKMTDGERWDKCYSSFGVNDKDNVSNTIELYRIQSNLIGKPFFLKDPRMTFVMEFYKDIFDHFIWIYREDEYKHINSLRRHYGDCYLSGHFMEGCNWSTNHFNHQVGNIDYSKFIERYEFSKESWINDISDKSFLTVSFESLIQGKKGNSFQDLEDFIGCNLDSSFIRS
jgi:hypothetical protein